MTFPDSDEFLSPEAREIRRKAVLEFIAWTRQAAPDELKKGRKKAFGWRLVAIERALRRYGVV